MTSDSNSRAHHQDVALLQAPASSLPPYHSPTLLLTNGLTTPSGSNNHHTTTHLPLVGASSMAVLPTKKPYDERTRLLDTNASPAANHLSPTSSSSTSPSTSEQDQVHPWYLNLSVPIPIAPSNNDSTPYHTYNTSNDPSKTGPPISNPQPPTVCTKLLPRAHSLSASMPSSSSATADFNIVGSGHKQQRRRHSILRASSSRSISDKPLRKSPSVEFALHQEANQKVKQADRCEMTSNSTPRRLTDEEREELYKIRPDLEVGPNPFYKEQLREMEQRNLRRTLFAILGGIMCIAFLMAVYYVLSVAS